MTFQVLMNDVVILTVIDASAGDVTAVAPDLSLINESEWADVRNALGSSLDASNVNDEDKVRLGV